MDQDDTRIFSVVPLSTSRLGVRWVGSSDVARIDLSNWIATGGEVLAPLRGADLFRTVRVSDHGATLVWGEDDGDLAIDAIHLKMIGDEQIAAVDRHSTRMVGA